MARWRLTAPHYLKVPGTEWEYKEVDRSTGKQVRRVYEVPAHLDPDQPGDWNYRSAPDAGEIIVAYVGKGQPKDIVFEGDPTPDMFPLDDEATAISKKFEAKWKHPIESLTGSYSEHILDQLQAEVADVRSKTAVPMEGITEILTAMQGMMKQNQELMLMLAGKAAEPAAKPEARRV